MAQLAAWLEGLDDARALAAAGAAVQFFDVSGEAISKVSVQRDENRVLLTEQVQQFETLRETMRA